MLTLNSVVLVLMSLPLLFWLLLVEPSRREVPTFHVTIIVVSTVRGCINYLLV
jgi:hypothetical protein